MVITVDAVGGDHFPQSPVRGAVDAVNDTLDLTVVLAGPEKMINEELEGLDYDTSRIVVQNAPEIIKMKESHDHAVKTKKNSSIVKGIAMHKEGKCDAFVSAGNTGALLAASTFLLGKLEGVTRPTIAAVFPTKKGQRLMIDAGANLEVRTDMYYQFAQMGTIYEEEVMGVENPTVGLLNIGEEEEKGTEDLREAYQELSELSNFVGNIEGNDIFDAKSDVFLADGLVGNLLLKFGESVPDALRAFISKGIQKLHLDEDESELVRKIIRASLAEFNPDNVGGVPFLGVNGVSVVGHGSSSALAIKNMILSARKCVRQGINEKIVASLK